ncbi:MAG: FadR/GntR family transcriptional regulator [Acidimicrobiales bacterium]
MASQLMSAGAAAALHAELIAARDQGGGRLPPERELANRHGLSRSTVRRWLDGLERDKAVERFVGRGTFVMPATLPEVSPSDIMVVRQLLEPQILALAVAHATPANIASMRRCLAAGAEAGDYCEFEKWDSRLHTEIAVSAGNGLLLHLFEVMNEARHNPVWGNAKRRSFTPERRAEYQSDHEALVDAIADRDAESAVGVMRAHLTRIRSTLLGDH